MFTSRSWAEAEIAALAYVSEGYWGADELGAQVVPYALHRLPENGAVRPGDAPLVCAGPAGREHECRHLIYIEEPTDPSYILKDHVFVSTYAEDGGSRESPGVVERDEVITVTQHSEHCKCRRILVYNPMKGTTVMHKFDEDCRRAILRYCNGL